MSKRIVVIGDIAIDVVARFTGPLQLGSDSNASVATYGGGSAANVAAWLAVGSGQSVVFVGRVGNDPAGRVQVEELKRAGVDVRVRVDAQHATGCVVVLVGEDGERSMLPDRGASNALSPLDLPPDVFTADGHMHLSAYPLLHDSSRAAALAALGMARDVGMSISVDPSSASLLAAAGASQFLEWTGPVDLCIANLEEARVLAGPGTPEELARRLASSPYREVVVKLGADGAIWSDGESVVDVPAAPAKVIATTGAGDAFAAGFLAAWTKGLAPRDALSAGTSTAAAAVAQVGARPFVTTFGFEETTPR